jgi:tetratricopeptide (TPR) repeat protein
MYPEYKSRLFFPMRGAEKSVDNPMDQRIAKRLENLHRAPRCGAKNRAGGACLACDLLAAEQDNNVFVPGVEYDRIDHKAAIPACEEAVKRDPGNPRLMHNFARSLDVAGRFDDAAYWYRQAADQGWAWSQNNLGVLYLYGRGVPLNFKRGVDLLRASAEQNNTNARVNYLAQDFSTLFRDDRTRTMIVQNGLVKRGLLQPQDANGIWGSATDLALETFKRSARLPERGLTLRVIDKLDIVDKISSRRPIP